MFLVNLHVFVYYSLLLQKGQDFYEGVRAGKMAIPCMAEKINDDLHSGRMLIDRKQLAKVVLKLLNIIGRMVTSMSAMLFVMNKEGSVCFNSSKTQTSKWVQWTICVRALWFAHKVIAF